MVVFKKHCIFVKNTIMGKIVNQKRTKTVNLITDADTQGYPFRFIMNDTEYSNELLEKTFHIQHTYCLEFYDKANRNSSKI